MQLKLSDHLACPEVLNPYIYNGFAQRKLNQDHSEQL